MITYEIEPLTDGLIKELNHLIDLQQIELWNDSGEILDLDWDTYYSLSEAGIFYCFIVRDKRKLVGYCSFMIGPDLHYKGKLRAMEDSIYVLPIYRKKGIGMELIRYSDSVLEREFNVESILRTVNVKIDFSPFLSRKGYELVEKTMIRRLK